MPTADQMSQEIRRMNILPFGRQKMRKTTWALMAANCGFNVIHLCADRGGAQVVSQITNPAAKKRIEIVNLENEPNKPIASKFLAKFLSKDPKIWWWDEKQKEVIVTPSGLIADHPIYEIDRSKLSLNDVIVLDSWTEISWCLHWQYAVENGLDFSEFSKMKDKWSDYGYTGHIASYFLSQLAGLNCHRVVIAHEQMYEKFGASPDGGKTQGPLLWSRLQIKSTSGNHAANMGVNFDMIRFVMVGGMIKLRTQPMQDEDGGCRGIPPADYMWDKLTFKDACAYLGIRLPQPKPCEAFKFYARADQSPAWDTRPRFDQLGKKETKINGPDIKARAKLVIPGLKLSPQEKEPVK